MKWFHMHCLKNLNKLWEIISLFWIFMMYISSSARVLDGLQVVCMCKHVSIRCSINKTLCASCRLCPVYHGLRLPPAVFNQADCFIYQGFKAFCLHPVQQREEETFTDISTTNENPFTSVVTDWRQISKNLNKQNENPAPRAWPVLSDNISCSQL